MKRFSVLASFFIFLIIFLYQPPLAISVDLCGQRGGTCISSDTCPPDSVYSGVSCSDPNEICCVPVPTQMACPAETTCVPSWQCKSTSQGDCYLLFYKGVCCNLIPIPTATPIPTENPPPTEPPWVPPTSPPSSPTPKTSYINPTNTPTPTPTRTPTPTPPTGGTPTPTITPTLTNTLTPTPTPTANPNCLCKSDNKCESSCSFEEITGVLYVSPKKCLLSFSLFPTPPSNENKNSWCQRKLRTKGDADGNGIIEKLDYFYYVTVVNGGKIPTSVNPDFNGDGEVGVTDREIVITSLNPPNTPIPSPTP